MGDIGELYVTREQLKQRLGVTGSTNDTLFDAAALAATDGVDNACDRQFNKATSPSARHYTAVSPSLLYVDDLHEITGLVVACDVDGDGVYETTLPSTSYALEPADGIVGGKPGWPYTSIHLRSGYGLPTDRQGVRVTAAWGWANVPANVTNAAYILGEEFAKLKDLPFGAGGYGDWGRIRARENPHVAILLADYRRNPVVSG